MQGVISDKEELICHLIKSENGKVWNVETSRSKCKSEILKEVLVEIRDNYKVKGVWAMFVKKSEQVWECVQVAQKHNCNLEKHSIGCEIAEDLEVMFYEIPQFCKECNNVVIEDRCFYKKVYARHRCEDCDSKNYIVRFKANRGLKRSDSIRVLSRRFDIYHDIAAKYDEIAIVCVQITKENEPRSKTLLKEKEYAEKHKAIYFY